MRKEVRKPRKMEGPFIWTNEHESTFQSIQHAIVTNAMAMPDPDRQYHLAVDASKRASAGRSSSLKGLARTSKLRIA